MHAYKGQASGVHGSCRPNAGALGRPRPYTDDSPAVIEEKFQAAKKEVRQAGMRSEDVAWPSSLTRQV
jgi:hypothetical protein